MEKRVIIISIDAIETMSALTPQEWRVLQILKEDLLKYDKLNNKILEPR